MKYKVKKGKLVNFQHFDKLKRNLCCTKYK